MRDVIFLKLGKYLKNTKRFFVDFINKTYYDSNNDVERVCLNNCEELLLRYCKRNDYKKL